MPRTHSTALNMKFNIKLLYTLLSSDDLQDTKSARLHPPITYLQYKKGGTLTYFNNSSFASAAFKWRSKLCSFNACLNQTRA